MKKLILFFIICACPFSMIEAKSKKDQPKEGWTNFTFKRSFSRNLHNVQFYNPVMFGSFDWRFVLRDNVDRTLTTSTLYWLLPSGDFVYVIQDLEKPIGYLQIKNWRIGQLFSRLNTILYTPDGEVILRAEYPYCSSAFKFYIPGEDDHILSANKGAFDFKVSMKTHDFFQKMSPNLFYSLLQIHASKRVLLDSAIYPVAGIIDGNKFSLYTEFLTRLAQKRLPPEPQTVEEEDLEIWLQLKDELEQNNDLVSLDDSERNQIASDLAIRLEDQKGEVSPECIFSVLDQLNSAEKTVLFELINARLTGL